MKVNVFLIALFFFAAVFSGSALAAGNVGTTYGPIDRPAANHQLQGEWGVATQYGNPTDFMGPTVQANTETQRISHLIGRDVYSPQGNYLGEIQNLEVAQNGRVAYVILSRGGETMRSGGNLVPVPWQAANLQVRNDHLTADITQRQLRDAPGFTQAQYAQINNPTYEKRVNGYYGTLPQNE